MIELYLIVTNILLANLTHLTVTSNHFKHHISWNCTMYPTVLLCLSKWFRRKEDRTNVSKNARLALRNQFRQESDNDREEGIEASQWQCIYLLRIEAFLLELLLSKSCSFASPAS